MKPRLLWKEAAPILAVVVVLLVSQIVFHSLWHHTFFIFTACICTAFLVFTFYFFRDPDRVIPEREDVLLAPADGRILSVESGVAPPIGDDSVSRIVIYLSLWDVHVNRIPVSGRVDRIDYQAGKFLPARSWKASHTNEQTIIRLRSGRGPVILKQVAGFLARRIVCNVRIHQDVTAGQRFGMIKFGSRVELYVPAGLNLHVRPGSRVKAGETIIGDWIDA